MQEQLEQEHVHDDEQPDADQQVAPAALHELEHVRRQGRPTSRW
jgi:hypothetical protein